MPMCKSDQSKRPLSLNALPESENPSEQPQKPKVQNQRDGTGRIHEWSIVEFGQMLSMVIPLENELFVLHLVSISWQAMMWASHQVLEVGVRLFTAHWHGTVAGCAKHLKCLCTKNLFRSTSNIKSGLKKMLPTVFVIVISNHPQSVLRFSSVSKIN